MRKLLFGLAILMAAALFVPPTLLAQATAAFNQRDDTYRVLGLKRAKETYDVAKAELERQQELFKRQLISETALDRARQTFSDAEVNYQQSLLAVLFEQQYITVSSAMKYYAKDGSRHVKLTLANMSGGSAEFRKLINIDDQLFRSLQPDIINNVYVSLLNDANAVISQPYETKIDQLRYGEPVSTDFTLLQDVDAVTVYMIYSNGSQRSMRIFLQKDAAGNKVAVGSEQFSQEVDLGKTASFDLTLELFSGTSNTFSLAVANLPTQISRVFKDPAGQVRLSQVKFTESTRTKRAALEITLPDRPNGDVVIDQPIPFYVVVMPPEKTAEVGDLSARQWTEGELSALNIGFVKLELLPRGKGKLLVRSNQLYHAIKDDQTVEMAVDLVNEGTHRLDNIVVDVDLPLNWSKTIDPPLVAALNIGEEKRVRFTFTPPSDVAVGKYDLRLRTTAMSNGTPVIGEDKTVTVEVQPQANLLGTSLVVLLILGLVLAIVVYGVRLSKR